jgi:hypothetical protein
LNVQITVSPCLPYSSVETFGSLLISLGDRVIVDTYTTGDGARGRRTATTDIPLLYREHELGNWRAEDAAHSLYDWVHERIEELAGWSQAGFAALPALVLNAP